MRTIFDAEFFVNLPGAVLEYPDDHHVRRELLLKQYQQFRDGESTAIANVKVKPSDLRVAAGAIYAELLPISQLDIYPAESDFQKREVLKALNESPVMMLHLNATSAASLRADYLELSRAVDVPTYKKMFRFVVAYSYGELIRTAVRLGGMHPATVQAMSTYSFEFAEEHWEKFRNQNNLSIMRDGSGRAPEFQYRSAAFIETEALAAIHRR